MNTIKLKVRNINQTAGAVINTSNNGGVQVAPKRLEYKVVTHMSFVESYKRNDHEKDNIGPIFSMHNEATYDRENEKYFIS